MQLLDGKSVSQVIIDRLKRRVEESTLAGMKQPHLAAVLVGNDGASETYVASKVRTCAEIGYRSTLLRFEVDITEHALLNVVRQLNEDPDVDGILIQLPLPPQISEAKVIEAIEPSKDVDGFHPVSAGKLMQGIDSFVPATPHGIMLLLDHYQIETKGMHAVVIGRSNIVGRPMSVLLSNNKSNCTVTLCHSHTRHLSAICREADLIVAALGKPGFLKEDMVREGAVVIDVGITRVADPTKKSGFSIKGDVDFDAVAPRCSYITPVPGGVGKMTIAALMSNTFKACLQHQQPA